VSDTFASASTHDDRAESLEADSYGLRRKLEKFWKRTPSREIRRANTSQIIIFDTPNIPDNSLFNKEAIRSALGVTQVSQELLDVVFQQAKKNIRYLGTHLFGIWPSSRSYGNFSETEAH
jgi:hypothetical protein